MDLRHGVGVHQALGFPRRRGDGPPGGGTGGKSTVFPPQARGWTPSELNHNQLVSVSPAGAGMDRFKQPGYIGNGCFPRRRGDGPGSGLALCRVDAFPPQARGWTFGLLPPS